MNEYKTRMAFVSGKYADIDDIPSMQFEWSDVAYSLAKICRFNGHCNQFYSVAQHCLHVSQLLGSESVETRLYGLLHDAHEMVLGDIVQPLKCLEIPVWRKWETNPIMLPLKDLLRDKEAELDKAIYEKAGLLYPVDENIVAKVKHADLVMLATEKIALMNVDVQDDWYDEKGSLLPDPDLYLAQNMPSMYWTFAGDQWLAEFGNLHWILNG